MNSCKKNQESTSSSTEIAKTKSTEISQVQEAKTFKNSKGEELKVTYFAQGDEVAVKIQKTGQEEQKLLAKTSNAAGNPIFTNENFMWEMTEDGTAGKLTDKDGNTEDYK